MKLFLLLNFSEKKSKKIFLASRQMSNINIYSEHTENRLNTSVLVVMKEALQSGSLSLVF